MTTPMVSTEDLRFTQGDDPRGKMGGRSVTATDKLKNFQHSGLTAMKDYEMASRDNLSLAFSGVKGFCKLLLSFKIAQTTADGAMFLHGRLTKEPFHAKMDENLESIMNDMSKGNMADVVKFDAQSYIECMDSFVLGDNVKLPDDSVQELNKILIKILITKGESPEQIKSDIDQFLNTHVDNLTSFCMPQDVVQEIGRGNGILTPRILLAKLANDLKTSGGDIGEKITQSFTNDCLKTAEFYDQRTAMSLYGRSLANLQIVEAATKQELSRLDTLRTVLNKSTDFLMRTVPYIYMFVVANLIIDRNGSGAVKTENFDNFMDENYSHLNQTDLDEIKSFAGNYFSTNTVKEFGLKLGNLLPTTMAISLYFLSTIRLGFNFISPEKQETYVNQAMAQLMKTYQAMESDSPELGKELLPSEDQPETSRAINPMKAGDGYQIVPLVPESDNEATDIRLDNMGETGSIASSRSNKSEPETVTTQQVVEPRKTIIDIDDIKSVNLEEIARDPGKYNLKSSAIARAYFETLSGSRESRLEKVYTAFSGGLIGVRALNNVAFEGKDATPDTPARNWFYDNVCSKIVVPLSAIENRGVIDKMVAEQEKSRVMDCFGKILDGLSLTDEDEDFMKGVIGTHGKLLSCPDSKYGLAKNANSIITAAFMAFNLGLLFTDFITAIRDPEGKSALDPIFQQSLGLMDAGLAYKLFYRPALEVLNMGTFAMQHGVKNISRYFTLAAINVIGRSITSAPALPLWNMNTTNMDTMATLVDSAGTTGHDQSTHTNLYKATLESNINQAKSLLHIFESQQGQGELWNQAFPSTTTEDPEAVPQLPKDDFSQFLSQRLDHVAKDLEFFSRMSQVQQTAPDRATIVT